MKLGISIVAGLFAALGLTASASASLTVQNFWHMGEDGFTNPSDAVGGKNFDDGFSTAVSSLHAPGSTASVRYNGFAGNYFNGNFPSIPTDNWVLELWINPSSFGSDVNVASLGTDDGHAKIGLSGSGTVFFGRENQSYGPATSTPLTLNSWSHIAYVQMGGQIHGYVNGVEAGAFDNANASTGNSGQIHLGVKPGGGQNLDGYLDDVRFSTFAPGAFRTSDLLYAQAVPEPGTMAALGLGALALLRRRRAPKA